MVKLYADGADLEQIKVLNRNAKIAGFTTNPSLARKAGIKGYAEFGQRLAQLTSKPISLEVIADDFNEMERQAKIIASWGENIYVKIPITNTKGECSVPLIAKLCQHGLKINVTAVFTSMQIKKVSKALIGSPAILSIFAGRIMDTGVNPRPLFDCARECVRTNVETLWASTRELYNIRQAKQANADIITIPNDLLAKMHLIGKNLDEYSLETVTMFYNDAKASGFVL